MPIFFHAVIFTTMFKPSSLENGELYASGVTLKVDVAKFFMTSTLIFTPKEKEMSSF
jgi:hypothetical protein